MNPRACPIIVTAPERQARRMEPVTLGVPFPRGTCREPDDLVLTDDRGEIVPLQARALDLWSDGTVRWALIDFQATCSDGADGTYRVTPSDTSQRICADGLTVRSDGGRTLVDTGAALFELFEQGRFPLDAFRGSAGSSLDSTRMSVTVTDASGHVHKPVTTQVAIEERGPLRACIRVDGMVAAGRARPWLVITARLHFFAGSAAVKFVLTVINPSAASHPGGIWELGSRGSVYLQDLSLTVAMQPSSGRTVGCSPEPGLPLEASSGPFELYQDSSGGANWTSANHVNRAGKVMNRFCGYRMRRGQAVTTGARATPIVAAGTAACAMQYFWQNFPKAMEASADSLIVRLFPRQYSDLYELQGGEQKTHTFFVAFGPDAVSDPPLDWCRRPLFARCTPAWYCSAEALPYLVPEDEDAHSDYVQLVRAAIDGPASFVSKREVIDEYGWRNFGDIYADHEAVYHDGDAPLISHYNNQYDAVAGMALQFFRTGDRRWWDLLQALAPHVVDIDIYHTDQDKGAYNGGMFWHTYHYVDAGKSTHRSYPRYPGVCGGGPSNEHNYGSGLMLQYFLTGDERYREAAIGLARWVLDMDDGNKTIFGWLSSGNTGVASATGNPLYHGPGRGAAYSIIALLNADRLTGDVAYLDKAEQLLRRCIHPRDDIEALCLLDAERRWYYTVFLQTLGLYLDYKLERGSVDFTYAYARESLLHYARWMADHEHPYLDTPEQLEYPTETWPALDMRKAEVFKHAAKHADPPDRRRFLERSEFFFRYSVTTLLGMETRGFTRPLVLLLSNGPMHAWFDRRAESGLAARPVMRYYFGEPAAFVPQKTIAKRRLVALAAAFGLIVLAIVLTAGLVR